MDKNIGKRIYSVAKVISIIGYIVSIAGAAVLVSMGMNKMDRYDSEIGFIMIGIGAAVLIVGCLSSWLSTLLLRGFGELVYNSSVLSEYGKADNKNLYKLSKSIIDNNTKNVFEEN